MTAKPEINNDDKLDIDKLIEQVRIKAPTLSDALVTGRQLLQELKIHNQNNKDAVLDDIHSSMQTCMALHEYDAAHQSVMAQLESMTGYGITQNPNPKCCNTYMRNIGYDETLNGDMFICDKCKRKKFYTHDEYYRMMADTYGRDIFGTFPEHLK